MVLGSLLLGLLLGGARVVALPQDSSEEELRDCGEARYYPSMYTCYDGDFLCPILNGEPTLRCGEDCYLPEMYSCSNGELVYPPGSSIATASAISTSTSSSATSVPTCTEEPTTQWLSDPPYENYFYSDCHSASQVVVTSPLEDSNLTIIGPRLLVAWPAGNSGVVGFFSPQNGVNGSLAIRLENGTSTFPLHGAYVEAAADSLSGYPFVGISTLVNFNSSAVLTVPIMGSIRNIRDFTEGPSLVYPVFQDAIEWNETDDGGVLLSRLWLDNVTTTQMSFVPTSGEGSISIQTNDQGNRTLELAAGTYNFTAWFDYPQLTQLNSSEVLNDQSQGLIESQSGQTTSLSFLSYSEKLLAGAWRFLTYFGRDSMIAALLLQPVLSEGEGGAIEAVIAAVLERLNKTSGIVCHEETIGDYATFLNLQDNITGPEALRPGCTYQMVDTDYYLAPLMENYFLKTETGRSRREAFFATNSSLDFGNMGLTYGELALINAEAVVKNSAPFAQSGGQTKDNLIHLEEDQLVGEWRDSTYGIGGGRIPYDVNTGLVPAALRSISALSSAGFFPSHPDWQQTAAAYAQVWEDNTLQFFQITIPIAEAKSLVENYTQTAGHDFPSHADDISADIVFHGLALDGNNNQSIVRVMNTDDCFRLFLTNTTNNEQLTSFLNQSANNILAPFPVGLSNPVGLLVANPAYGDDPVYAANWTNNAYHGTVVWSWQLAMTGAGLQRQLERCSASTPAPAFCQDEVVRGNVRAAYNHLWDLIEANEPYINNEVWSWLYQDGEFTFEPLGALPPPAGLNPTESNVRQLWSLTWLAVTRDESLR
ncbi:carbohydrate-binding module family 52 protein [Zasmidium cellare ATCC 36951]|uniref:Carbohydrate-binding module family 52 protein n=1 Tax=Zasmidium cellare ATCC 36951 TaxID=1080233 RepID=A0A6A6D1N8_ZASCE|nr:carbohydrate-binding module family 52 protein [Zasmidium cellare ATCC 36951]KAF2172082.1 carbohydrate-binding module family 52 protein [Zasmidium cellare ATCC 36951]